MADSITVAFDNDVVTPSLALQLQQYDALLEFPEERVVKHEASDLTIVSTLGKEGFCEVLLVQSQSQNKQLFMKRLDSEKIRSTQDFLAGATDLATEARFLSKLDHKNITKLRGVCATPFSDSYGKDGCGYFFTMDAMEETLKDRLQKWRSDLSLSCYNKEPERCHKLTLKKRTLEIQSMYDRLETVALAIADAMEYLQDRGIVLRDLQPSTIGYNDATGEICLLDFSFARYRQSCRNDKAYRSAHYTAPEVRRGEGYSLKSDVYSFGLILDEIASLRREWRSKRSTNDEDSASRPALEDIPCENIQVLIEECWSEDPELRPSFEIICMTMSAMIASSRKRATLRNPRGSLVLKQAVDTSGAESNSTSTLTTLDSLYDDDEEDFDFDELATLEC
mmetsp:Transcript_19623/g.48262  ORF Transcript_19623/g.48262 Transcript_19623/m.48262 type:complete len:394 (-) Transcript_19623:105-1286(-)